MCDLVIRLINNSPADATFSISESGAADALDESVFSPPLPGNSRLGECPCEVTVAANSSAAYGLRVEVGDVTPGWYTSRVRVHRLHTGGRLLASFQLKIDEVGPPRSDPCTAAAGGDYDIDDDGLIEICNLAQLNAIRWDLDGDGAADVYPPDKDGVTGHDPDGAAKLAVAFPNAITGMGCPTGGCEGYELSADLDFDTNANGRADPGDTYWNNGLGWHPLIGGAKINSAKELYRFWHHAVAGGIVECCGHFPNPRARMFTAEFEGNGRTIANLYINDPVLDYVGLFGIIGHGAHVRNVGLTAPNADSKVVGGARVGALAGDIERGRVSGVYSDLDVSGGRKVGGLAGSIWRFGFIIESYATGDVTGSSMAGGLLGILSGSGVAAVYATGDVTVAVNEGGGLAGYRADGHLRAAYATGSVSYTGVHSSPGWRIGGLVGGYSHSWTQSWMRANYATGRVSSPNAEITSGGLTGGCTLSKRERSEGANYWDVEATGMADSPDCGMGYTTAQLQAPTGYTGIYADWNVDVNVGYHGSFLGPGDDPWDFGTSTQYPVLKYCAEKPGIETPDGQPYCPLQPDNQRDPSSGQVETDSSPVVNVAAATNISEGQSAAFVIAANPSASADLPVNISVTATGDYGVTAETTTVTVPAGGSYTLSVATADDSVDEDDGTVTVTIDTGTGYTVSETSGAASVTVHDDDEPKLSIAAVDTDIAEGGVAVFALTAVPVPASPLSVNVSVVQSGDFGVSPGSRQVTVPTSGSVTLTVATANDSADEADGSVTATVSAGRGYAVSATAGSATVAVADDDDPVLTGDPCVVALSGDGSVTGEWAAGCVSSVRGGRYALFYSFSLDSPSVVTVDLESSVDTYMYLRAGVGQKQGAVLESDDDGGDGYDSRISRTLAAGGYTIEATTYRASAAGSFTLTVAGIPAQTVVQPDAELQQDPEVSITAGADIVEGGVATFTVSAVPAPSAGLDVTVAVTASGGFGVAPGSRTVTVPTSGSVTLTVATTDDSADEADGSVDAAVAAGSGYTVSATGGSASVAVADDDDPPVPPSVCVPSLPSDAVTVSEVTGWRDGHSGAAHVLRWNRVLAALGADTGVSAMTVEQSRAYESQFMHSRWDRVTRTLEALEQCDDPPPPPPPVVDPEISITAGGGITEGGDATFTITADPAPSVALTVDVTVAQTGDLGVSPGTRAVTIPTSGAVMLSVATTNDAADEADGSVTAAVDAGSGYTVSATAGSASVAVADDDDPAPPPPPVVDPEVSISAAGGVTEGGDAAFTVTAVPAPAAPLTVTVSVAQVGDFGAGIGSRQVIVPTSSSVTLTVATADDGADEADGSVTVTVDAGSGYTVSATAGTATVAVADDDPASPPPPPSSKPTITVDDATAGEGDGAVEFTVRLSAASTAAVTVYYAANPGTAMPYADYLPEWGRITFAAGDTSKTVRVSLIDDRTPGEGDETFVLKLILTDTTHATLADSQAQGTITDND